MARTSGKSLKERRSNYPDVSLNLAVRGLGLSATLRINQLSRELASTGRQLFRLGLGQSPFPVPESVVAALRANAHQRDYLDVRGLLELRQAVADYNCRTQGVGCSPADILIGPGSKELMFLVQLVYYGDLVIPSPSWVSYAPQARIIGRLIHWLPTQGKHGWRLMPEELEKLCQEDKNRPRIVILNYPSNPSGLTYRTEELQSIAQVARRYRLILLSDEIYGELNHQGQHVSIARFYPEGTIISSGLSKWCGAGGWRLGTFSFPPPLSWLRDAVSAAASETYTSTSAPIQYAAITAFRGDESIDQYLRRSRRILRALGRHMAKMMQDAGIDVWTPQGGFYLFPDFEPFREGLAEKGIRTSAELCEALLSETGVAVLPGSAFGRDPGELTVRAAYVDFDGKRALRKLAELGPGESISEEFLKTCCRRMLRAAERLIDWLPRPGGS